MTYIQLEGFSGYRVSDDGRIQSRMPRGSASEFRGWADMAPSEDTKGYMGLTLIADDGRRVKKRVHVIVCEAFHGRRPFRKACVRHLDGDSKNNSAENLARGTYSDNERDKHASGTYWTRRNGKLTQHDASIIRELRSQGVSQSDLAKDFGVSRTTITRIVNGTIWKDE